MQFAPAIQPDLIRLVDDLDDGTEVIAAIWRELGRRARRRHRLQPSYESVRRLVHVQRARRRRLEYVRVRRTAILTAQLRWGMRNRKGITLDVFGGHAVVSRQSLDQRRPRDDPSRLRPPGAA